MKKFILSLLCMCAFPQAQTPFKVYQSSGSSTGSVWLQERRTNGVNFLKLEAPQSIASDFSLILPSALPAVNGECVTGTTAGVLSFGACGAANAFVQGGNSFGATAELGTGDAFALQFTVSGVGRWLIPTTGHLYAGANNTYDIGAGISANSPRTVYASTSVVAPLYGSVTNAAIGFQTDSATRWNVTAAGMFVPFIHDTYDIGLTGTRVRGVYAGFGEFWKSGGTASSDYATSRKFNILDQTGSSGAWDIQAAGSFVSNSWFMLRDNGGGRAVTIDRAVSGSRLSNFGVFGSIFPRKRVIADGDDVNDTVFGDFGGTSARWANIYGAAMDLSGAANITGNLSAAVINATGSPAYRVSGTSVILADRSASFTGLTVNTATPAAVGQVWTATSTGGAGSWQTKAAAYDIRDYGGLCNGVADDTAAFTAAFAAIAGNFGRITIPSGRCMVTQIVPNNSYIGISGQGKWSSSIESISTSGQSIIKMTPLSKFYYLEFSGFALRGRGDINSLSQVGIEVTGANGINDSSIHDMEFRKLAKGIYDRNTGVTGSGHIQIHNNQFSMGFYPTLPTVTAASNASPVSFTSTAHGQTGSISISIGGATGSWTSVNGTFTGTVTSANTFTIPVDSSGFGALAGSLVVTLLVHNPGIGIERDNEEGSGWQITDNDFGGLAEIVGATSGNRAIYFHRFVGDLMIVGNHIEGGWIGIDLSCDGGTFATGKCTYGQNVLAVGNKIDGIPYEYRLYNISSSDFTGNRGRGIDRSYITSGGGGSSTQNQYTPNAVAASGNSAAGLEMSGVGGNLALNTYDSGRIRIGDTATNLSALTNGISVFDASASSGIAFGQSDTRKVLLAWTYNATASSGLANFSTASQANPILYGASFHLFQTGSLSRWAIDATGEFQPQADNAYPIGDTNFRASNVFSVLGNYSGLLTAGAGLTVSGGTSTFEEIRFGAGSTYSVGSTGARALRVFTQGITTGGPSYWESGSDFIMRSGSIMTLEFGTPGAGKVLTSDAAGVATWETAGAGSSKWTTTGADIYRSSLVGIGTTAPVAPLHVSGEFSAFFLDGYSATSPNILQRHARGTEASPTASQSGDRIGQIAVQGYGTSRVTSGQIKFMAGSLHSGTNAETYISLATTASASTSATDRWRVSSAGHWLAEADNTYDIGASGATRPRNYFGAGTMDIIGNLSAAVINATGSPAYRVSGTTVIDASRHATFVNLISSGAITLSGTISSDIVPTTNNSSTLGNGSFYWNQIRGETLFVENSGRIRPTTTNTGSVGISTARFNKGWFTDLDLTGTIIPPSGTAFSGTKTVRASGGAGDCTLTFSSGIMTGGTC